MPEHYTKNTVSATCWCAKCGKPTLHRVDGGRRGPCYACMEAKPAAVAAPEEAKVEQGKLFGGR